MNYIKHLEEFGYCVIPNILSNDECNIYISQLWDWLEGLNSGIDRNKPDTWTDEFWPPNIYGITSQFNISHQQFVWDIRSNKNVIDVFSNIWETRELLVSFDAINIMRPKEFIEDIPEWFHVDQSSFKNFFCCVQGYINLEDTGEDDSTLVLYEGSHNYHTSLFENNGLNTTNNYYHLSEKDIDYIKSLNLKKKRIIARKGSLVLWDSRTIHCNCSSTTYDDKFRYAIYICMTPKMWCDEYNKEKKIKAFNELRATSHWPHEIILKRDIKNKEELQNFTATFKKPVLSITGQLLVGLLEYE